MESTISPNNQQNDGIGQIPFRWEGPKQHRTPRKSSEAWASHEAQIRELHASMTLDDLAKALETQHGFVASHKQYRHQFQKWGLQKYLPKKPGASAYLPSPGPSQSTYSPSMSPGSTSYPQLLPLAKRMMSEEGPCHGQSSTSSTLSANPKKRLKLVEDKETSCAHTRSDEHFFSPNQDPMLDNTLETAQFQDKTQCSDCVCLTEACACTRTTRPLNELRPTPCDAQRGWFLFSIGEDDDTVAGQTGRGAMPDPVDCDILYSRRALEESTQDGSCITRQENTSQQRLESYDLAAALVTAHRCKNFREQAEYYRLKTPTHTALKETADMLDATFYSEHACNVYAVLLLIEDGKTQKDSTALASLTISCARLAQSLPQCLLVQEFLEKRLRTLTDNGTWMPEQFLVHLLLARTHALHMGFRANEHLDRAWKYERRFFFRVVNSPPELNGLEPQAFHLLACFYQKRFTSFQSHEAENFQGPISSPPISSGMTSNDLSRRWRQPEDWTQRLWLSNWLSIAGPGSPGNDPKTVGEFLRCCVVLFFETFDLDCSSFDSSLRELVVELGTKRNTTESPTTTIFLSFYERANATLRSKFPLWMQQSHHILGVQATELIRTCCSLIIEVSSVSILGISDNDLAQRCLEILFVKTKPPVDVGKHITIQCRKWVREDLPRLKYPLKQIEPWHNPTLMSPIGSSNSSFSRMEEAAVLMLNSQRWSRPSSGRPSSVLSRNSGLSSVVSQLSDKFESSLSFA